MLLKEQKQGEKDLLAMFLPEYGEEGVNTPIWDEERSMYITDQYISQAGHLYYKGIRITERYFYVLNFGMHYNFTYLDEVTLYTFDKKEKKIAGTKKLDKSFYNEELVKEIIHGLLFNYLASKLILNNTSYLEEELHEKVDALVRDSYKTMLEDESTIQLLQKIPGIIENNKNIKL